jgi:hypothetical protein
LTKNSKAKDTPQVDFRMRGKVVVVKQHAADININTDISPMEDIEPEINSQLSVIISNKDAKRKIWEKESSSISVLGKCGYPYMEKMNPNLTPHARINSKFINDLNVRP